MIPPVRCWTCNKVLPSLRYEQRLRAGQTSKQALDELGLPRICCRRMLIAHPPEIEDFMLMQDLEDVVDERQNYTMKMVMRCERVLSTE